jgi:hypothetical protein
MDGFALTAQPPLLPHVRMPACGVWGLRYRPMMGLTVDDRRLVTKTIATRYKRADRAAK